MAGFGLKDSIKNINDYQYSKIFKYDKMMIINENGDYEKLLNKINNEEIVNKAVDVNYQSISVLNGDIKQDVSLIVPNDFNRFNEVVSLIDYKNEDNIYDDIR